MNRGWRVSKGGTAVGVVAMLGVLLVGPAPLAAGAPPGGAAQAEIGRVLDDWHDAAAKADEARYFSHFAPEAVFLGTDAGERWDVAAFRAFVHPYFAQGRGWEYRPRSRSLQLSPEGDLVWFDELLDNASYGECRGTGVLRRVAGSWKIAQYSLSIPIPNDLAKSVVESIRKRARPTGER